MIHSINGKAPSSTVSHPVPAFDQLDIAFDDTHAVANAGYLLLATLAPGWASSRQPMS